MKNRYIAIIPARAGSVRLKGKNIIDLGGKPLIAYTIQAAKQAAVFEFIIVSTDGQPIADVAKDYGIPVTKLRPPELATAVADVVDVMVHELKDVNRLPHKEDIIVLLQPTSPFRTSEQLKQAVYAFENSDADTLTSVIKTSQHPYWAWKDAAPYIVPYHDLVHVQMGRQDLPVVYSENGAIFMCKRSLLEDKHALYGEKIIPYVMDAQSSVDIDTPDDLALANFFLSQSHTSL